MTAANAIAST